MLELAHSTVHKYLRPNKKFPHVWCPGCGIGIVLGAIIRAVDRMELEKDHLAMVSGIGCSGRMPVYVDFNTLHTTHGRALAFATGLKLASPDLTVMVIMGDGDALAIGGNHFIHTARRNLDLTAIIINNDSYAMTGGQYSPTTPTGMLASTAIYGNIEQPFDIAKLAEAAGAPFVARGTVYHARELDRLIEKALRKKGFSVLEVISHCHVGYGRINRLGSAVEMMKWQRDNTIPVVVKGEKAEGKIPRGVLVDKDLPEYIEEYQKVIERARAQAAS